MKVLGLLVCFAVMTASVAQANIVGSWTTESAGGGYTRLLLTVTPTGGETMNGFDIRVADSLSRGIFRYSTGTQLAAGKDTYTSFLLNQTHYDEILDEDVTDLTVNSSGVTNRRLYGAFAWSNGGAYAGGWSSALQLLEIIFPSTSTVLPSELTFTLGDGTGSAAAVATSQGTKTLTFATVPEPSTLALLATGLVGLFCYGWRKRK